MGRGEPKPRCRCGQEEPSPGEDVGRGEPKPRCKYVLEEPSPGADVGRVNPIRGMDFPHCAGLAALCSVGRCVCVCVCVCLCVCLCVCVCVCVCDCACDCVCEGEAHPTIAGLCLEQWLRSGTTVARAEPERLEPKARSARPVPAQMWAG